MQTRKTVKKLLITTILAGSLTPQINVCAALPEEKEIPEAEQKALDKLLIGTVYAADQAALKVALIKGANPNARGLWSHPAIWKAAERGQPEIVQQLIDAGADINSTKGRDTVLHRAVAMLPTGSCVERDYVSEDAIVNVAQKLIAADIDLNAANYRGNTCLVETFFRCSSRMIQLLIAANADENTMDTSGISARTLMNSRRYNETICHTMRCALLVRKLNIHAAHKTYTTGLKRTTYPYILDGPLPLEPLVNIFSQYAEYDPVEAAKQRATQRAIEASERQKQRAEETRKNALIRRAQQRGTP